MPPGLLSDFEALWQEPAENAQKIAELRHASPLGRVLSAGLSNVDQHRVVIKEAIEEAGRHVVHQLEYRISTLGTIAAITPLLGLLGTVIGMIKVFSAITVFGVGDPSILAGGISEALVTTAAGLCVGIPSLLFYRYFRARVNEITVYMEQEAIRFLELLVAKRKC